MYINPKYQNKPIGELQKIEFKHLYIQLIIKKYEAIGIDEAIAKITKMLLDYRLKLKKEYNNTKMFIREYRHDVLIPNIKMFLNRSYGNLNSYEISKFSCDMIDKMMDQYKDQVCVVDTDEIFINGYDNAVSILHWFLDEYDIEMDWELRNIYGYFKSPKKYILNCGGKLIYKGVKKTDQIKLF